MATEQDIKHDEATIATILGDEKEKLKEADVKGRVNRYATAATDVSVFNNMFKAPTERSLVSNILFVSRRRHRLRGYSWCERPIRPVFGAQVAGEWFIPTQRQVHWSDFRASGSKHVQELAKLKGSLTQNRSTDKMRTYFLLKPIKRLKPSLWCNRFVEV
jgi:hypothetical protein